MLDIGCGDGQTFALMSDAIPAGSAIHAIEPNAEYVKAFEAHLTPQGRLQKGTFHCKPFSPDLLGKSKATGSPYALILAVHVLYFFEDLEASLLSIYQALSPGGVAFIVFADEETAYTGLVFRAYMRASGHNELAEAHAELCRNRLKLFAQDQTGADTLTGLIGRTFAGTGARIDIQRQETRLYGHSIGDIVALCNIAGLQPYLGTDKFEAAADLIEHSPEAVDFRIENDPKNPRYGMFSVQQPQIVAAIRKPGNPRQ